MDADKQKQLIEQHPGFKPDHEEAVMSPSVRRAVEAEMNKKSATRTFSLAQVVSITDGHLLCDMGGVYDILNFLTGEDLFTHALPRAGEAARPVLLRRFPQLTEINLEGKVNKDNYLQVVADLEAKYGKTFDLEPLSASDYEAKHPLAEPILAGKEVVAVVAPDRQEA